MIVEPPLLFGAFQSTAARALPAEAVTLVGAPGTVRGVPDTTFEPVLLPTEL